LKYGIFVYKFVDYHLGLENLVDLLNFWAERDWFSEELGKWDFQEGGCHYVDFGCYWLLMAIMVSLIVWGFNVCRQVFRAVGRAEFREWRSVWRQKSSCEGTFLAAKCFQRLLF